MRWPDTETKITRTMDADRLNEIANDSRVRPWLGGDAEVLDLSAQLANPANLAGIGASGGFVAVSLGEGRYEIHSVFLPMHGTETIRLMRASVDYIFSSSDATELVTKVPHDNAPADGLAKLAGFATLFSGRFPWTSTEHKNMDVRSLRVEQWAARSDRCHCMGRWLHEQFACVLKSRHSSAPPHSPDEDIHDRMAGASAMMIRAGNVAKGVTLYNRWASLTGYPIIRWLRDHPVVLDLEGMIVEVTGEHIEVLTCQ